MILLLKISQVLMGIGFLLTSTASLVEAAPATPVLGAPKWQGATKSESIAAVGGWSVTLKSVSGASSYNICLKNPRLSKCYFQKQFKVSPAPPAGNSIDFGVSIPANMQGSISEWRAQACDIKNQCSAWSQTERFVVAPEAATLVSAGGSTLNPVSSNTRRLTFKWNANPYAKAGYQLIIYRPGGVSSSDVYSLLTGPSRVKKKMVNLSIAAGTTSHHYTVPTDLGTSIRWGVTSCVNVSGKGRVCSLGWNVKSLSLPSR